MFRIRILIILSKTKIISKGKKKVFQPYRQDIFFMATQNGPGWIGNRQIRNYLAARIRIHNLELRIQGSRSEAMSSICRSGTLIWVVLSNVQYMLNTVNRYCNIFHNLSRIVNKQSFFSSCYEHVCLICMHVWLVLFDTLVSYIPHRKTRCEFLSAF